MRGVHVLSSSEEQPLRMDGPIHPSAIFLCHLCDHPHSLTCTCHGVRDGPGPAQPRLRGNSLMQEGLDPASRSCTFRMGHPPRPRSSSLPMVCRVQDPCRMGLRQCQRLSISMLRPERTRTFAPAPAQHNIPIDGLFSFTLPCAIQNPWCLPAAFWFRYKQKVLTHVGPSEAVGIHGVGGCADCSSKPPFGHQPRPRRMPSWRRCRRSRTGRTHLLLDGRATRTFSSHQRSLLCGGQR